MKMKMLASALIAGCLLATTASFAQTKEVKLSTWVGPTHPVNVGGYTPFVREIEADKAANIKFRMFIGGSLLDPRGTLPGLRDGVADGGFVVFVYHPAEFPHGVTFGDLSMVGTDPLSSGAAVTETILLHCAPCLAEAKKQNLLFFGAYGSSAYNILSRVPVKSIEDLKGKKIRTSGGAADRWLREVGAVAVTVDAGMAYEGLAKNTIDGVLLPVSDLGAYNLWDVAPHVNMLPVGSFKANTSVGFNRNFWKSLTLDQRKAFLKQAPVMVYGPGIEYNKLDAGIVAQTAAKKVTLSKPSDAMTAHLNAFIAKDRSAIVEAAKKRGVKDPEILINKYVELVAKYERLFKGKETDPTAMHEILHREIYSKLDPATFGMD